MFPSHVLLGLHYMEVSLVLVKVMVPGIHHLQHVKVMRQNKMTFFSNILLFVVDYQWSFFFSGFCSKNDL